MLQQKLYLGNLEAKRDWGYAEDYVEAMWMMLQQEVPDDFVIATGESHSVKEFVIKSFDLLGLDWQKYVETDARYFRPTEVDFLLGNATKAKEKMKWQPKVNFNQLAKIMVESDMQLAQKEVRLTGCCGSTSKF